MSQVRDDVEAAITAALARHETSLPNRWLVMVETIEEDGSRSIWMLTQQGATAWDTLGLLQYGTAYEQALISKRTAEGEI